MPQKYKGKGAGRSSSAAVPAKRRGPKKKAPRPASKADFIASMDLRRHFREDLLKEVIASYEVRNRGRDGAAPKAEALQLRRSVYFYWWFYLQAAKKYGLAEGKKRKSQDIAATLTKFGDLRLPFREWWASTGRKIFSENGLPLITVEAMDHAFDVLNPHQFPKHITLKIPLTVPAKTIRDQLNRILEICHPGNSLHIHESSTAEVKIYPKQNTQIETLSRCLRIWRAVQKDIRRYPKEEDRRAFWEIGRDLRLNGSLDVKGDNQAAISNRTNLQTQIRRDYEKADRLIRNAVQGHFPRR